MTLRADVELKGLDGLNLLGFLAAMGTLVTLDSHPSFPDLRLRWQLKGSWTPILSSSAAITPALVVASLAAELSRPQAVAAFSLPVEGSTVADNLTMSPSDYRRYSSGASDTARSDPRLSDFAASFACDGIGDDKIQDTAFRTMSGAGHQHFLKFMRQLVELTSAEHVERALFAPWVYEDDGPSLRWDPEDDRRYALRWKEPATDKIRSVRGANRLAIEGLRLFPSVPRSGRLMTTGFTGERATDTRVTWPLWAGALPLSVVRSVVGLRFTAATDQRDEKSTTRDETLDQRGIREVITSSRITTGKFRSFTPALPL